MLVVCDRLTTVRLEAAAICNHRDNLPPYREIQTKPEEGGQWCLWWPSVRDIARFGP